MKKMLILFICLIAYGCSTVTGPSGKKYSSVGGQIANMPAYTQDLREHYLANNLNDPKEIREAISKGEVLLGMNKEQVRASWGLPESVNTTIVSGLVHEQHIYKIYHNSYIYFENDKLVSIQN